MEQKFNIFENVARLTPKLQNFITLHLVYPKHVGTPCMDIRNNLNLRNLTKMFSFCENVYKCWAEKWWFPWISSTGVSLQICPKIKFFTLKYLCSRNFIVTGYWVSKTPFVSKAIIIFIEHARSMSFVRKICGLWQTLEKVFIFWSRPKTKTWRPTTVTLQSSVWSSSWSSLSKKIMLDWRSLTKPKVVPKLIHQRKYFL